MTKDRVVVGKIESWLAKFESWATTSGWKSRCRRAHAAARANSCGLWLL